MLAGYIKILAISALVLTGCILCSAQTAADNRSPIFSKPGEPDRPRNIQESLERMRIEREKKEFDRMIERGEEALKIASELENLVAEQGHLTEKEISKLAAVEKLAKQIRKDLGGDDDEADSPGRSETGGFSLKDAVSSLRASTEDLFEELKKTSRFTVSAAAIKSSNAVLRLARFMRVGQ